MIRKALLIAALALTGCATYGTRTARFIDGSENEKPPMAVWVCVPDDDATNITGVQCARMDRVFGLSPTKHDPTKPAHEASNL